jgi:general nucleoside transport system permease protein
MDLSAINPLVLIVSLMVAATPILLAAIGELVVEKSGVLNLGVEGMMITGAIFGFAVAVETGSPTMGFIGGALGGAGLALIFAILTQLLLANQVATGLALTLFGLGFSALIGQGYIGVRPPGTARIEVPLLVEIPVLGRILFRHDLMVYVSLALVVAVWLVLKYTRMGLVLRAVGESHDAAHACHPVRRRLCGAGRRLSQPDPCAAMDRRHDRRGRLDCVGDRRLRLVAAVAGAAGRLFVWRNRRASA